MHDLSSTACLGRSYKVPKVKSMALFTKVMVGTRPLAALSKRASEEANRRFELLNEPMRTTKIRGSAVSCVICCELNAPDATQNRASKTQRHKGPIALSHWTISAVVTRAISATLACGRPSQLVGLSATGVRAQCPAECLGLLCAALRRPRQLVSIEVRFVGDRDALACAAPLLGNGGSAPLRSHHR